MSHCNTYKHAKNWQVLQILSVAHVLIDARCPKDCAQINQSRCLPNDNKDKDLVHAVVGYLSFDFEFDSFMVSKADYGYQEQCTVNIEECCTSSPCGCKAAITSKASIR